MNNDVKLPLVTQTFRRFDGSVRSVVVLIEGHPFLLTDNERHPRELEISLWGPGCPTDADRDATYAKQKELIERGLVKQIYEGYSIAHDDRDVWLPHTLQQILDGQEA